MSDMPTTQGAVRAVSAWFEGENPARHLKSLDSGRHWPTKKPQLNSYGPHFPLIVGDVTYDDELLVNTEEKISNTTSRHQRAVEEVLRARGYTPTDRTEEVRVGLTYGYGTRTFRVWEREA